MEKVKVLVVEDETIIAESIVKMVEKMGYVCVGTAIRAESALKIAREKKPDIALLDIHLKGEKTGVWLAQQLNEELNIPFVYITSFTDEKTIKHAASTLPSGYLVKPISYPAVFAAIATALSRFSENKQMSLQEQPFNQRVVNTEEENLNSSLRIKDLLFIKDEYQYVKIVLADIDFIKSDGNYLEIYYSGKKKVVKETLKNILTKVDDNFVQTHRSYVVNIRKIDSIGSSYLMLDQTKVPLTKTKREELLALLNAL